MTDDDAVLDLAGRLEVVDVRLESTKLRNSREIDYRQEQRVDLQGGNSMRGVEDHSRPRTFSEGLVGGVGSLRW